MNRVAIQTVLPPLRGSVNFFMAPWVSCALRTPPTAGIRSSVVCHPRLGYRHRYAIQKPWVMCTPLASTSPTAGISPSLRDSCGVPPTAGHRRYARGLKPTVGVRPPVGCHPRLGYSHHYVVLFRHEFEEDGGAVLQGGRVDGDVGDDIPFGERKFLTACAVEAKGV